MGTLSYTATISLDGYAADATGDFQWSAPGEDVFQFNIDRFTTVSTEILGRKTYELMTYWESEPGGEEWGEQEHEFSRLWTGLDHHIASSTLDPATLPKAYRHIRNLDLGTLKQIVSDAPGEVEIFGPTTATPAILGGLVSDFRIFIVPKIVGGGLRAIPDGANLDLSLVEHHPFDSGAVYFHYRQK